MSSNVKFKTFIGFEKEQEYLHCFSYLDISCQSTRVSLKILFILSVYFFHMLQFWYCALLDGVSVCWDERHTKMTHSEWQQQQRQPLHRYDWERVWSWIKPIEQKNMYIYFRYWEYCLNIQCSIYNVTWITGFESKSQ